MELPTASQVRNLTNSETQTPEIKIPLSFKNLASYGASTSSDTWMQGAEGTLSGLSLAETTATSVSSTILGLTTKESMDSLRTANNGQVLIYFIRNPFHPRMFAPSNALCAHVILLSVQPVYQLLTLMLTPGKLPLSLLTSLRRGSGG